MNFDVGFFGLPYGENVNTTRIVYDPTIIIYHIPGEPGVTWVVISILMVSSAAVFLMIICIVRARKSKETFEH